MNHKSIFKTTLSRANVILYLHKTSKNVTVGKPIINLSLLKKTVTLDVAIK